jgi:hypothetical protein
LSRILRPLASLRLTVVLLALLMVLVFAGTWAQIDMGIWSTLNTYFRSFLVWIPLGLFLPRAWDVPGAVPYPGGYLLGSLLTVNLVTAHAFRFGFGLKRSGILLIHVGLILLIAGELVTAMYAEEANMSIDEGETVNFAEDVREIELAIIDITDPDADKVIAIPRSRLARGGVIQHPELPFEIHVDRYHTNTELFAADELPDGLVPRVTQGTGARRNIAAVERPPVSGVESNVIDLPAAYVSLYEQDEKLGTWLTSLYFYLSGDFADPLNAPQLVEAGGRTYRMVMRYKRIYKPYSISLIDFRHDRYVGTDTPKNFSSQVRLVDPTNNEDREVLIYMNNPLRYRGETFYQASFKRGDQGTVLQVVRNPGWLLPYIACTLGAIGMLIHFGISLVTFLRRSRA